MWKTKRLAIGPQSSFTSSEPNEAIQVMKSVSSSLGDHLHETINHEQIQLKLIHDVCEAFHKNHGTGTSSLITYIVLLLELFDDKQMFPHSPHSPHSHSHHSLIFNSLKLFESIFMKSCHALLISSDPWIQPLGQYSQHQSEESILKSQSDPSVDEFGWFFDDPIPEVTTIPPPALLESPAIVELDPLSVQQTDQQIFCGLQHSLWWDYPTKSSPSLCSSCAVRHLSFSSLINP